VSADSENLKFGLTLSNRGVVLGTQSPAEMIDLAAKAEETGLFDSVWVGDSLFVNPRLDSVTLLAAIAGRTSKVLLGPACMGSFALRNPLAFAYQWAALDQISGGRTRLIACAGGGAGHLWEAEAAAMGVPPKERRKRIVEHLEILRRLWTEDDVNFEADFFQFSGITMEPKPVQDPCPIWMATNAQRLSSGTTSGSDRGLRRVGRYADGWQTHTATPEAFRASWEKILATAEELGRDTSNFGNCLYHNIHVSDDHEESLKEARQFLEAYYETGYTRERVEAWTALGTPEECIENLRTYRGSGVQRITLRLCSNDQFGQLERVVRDVLPYVNDPLEKTAQSAGFEAQR
jgi:alkanesulfonate monooxygenase SsuD/methylene tetrahydromethanopterin reductase-like flavin-dependent oxidoreductase (luciferase family)